MSFGCKNDGPGDDEPLLLSAAELVRILSQVVVHGHESHVFQRLTNAAFTFFGIFDAVDDQRLIQNAPHVHERRQRAKRILLYESDLAAIPSHASWVGSRR